MFHFKNNGVFHLWKTRTLINKRNFQTNCFLLTTIGWSVELYAKNEAPAGLIRILRARNWLSCLCGEQVMAPNQQIIQLIPSELIQYLINFCGF